MARVRVDGVWVDGLWPCSDLEYSSGFLLEQPSGDLEASISVALPENYETSWTLPGRVFEVHGINGGLLFGGWTSEPDRDRGGNGGITLVAKGYGSLLSRIDARRFEVDVLPTGEDGWLPTYIPNEAVDEAEARGWPIHRDVDLGSSAVPTDPDDPVMLSVWEVLQRAATALGKRVYVDSQGYVTYVDSPTSPTYTTTPDPTYMGTSDDKFVTHLTGYFIANNGGVDTEIGYEAADEDAADKFSRSERNIDLRDLGPMPYSEGVAYTDGRFALVGGRMAWTDTVDLTDMNLLHMNGVWADPRNVRGGDMLQVAGVTDHRSNPTTRAAIWFVIQEARVTESNLGAETNAAPVGFSPRDFEGALTRPEKPSSSEGA